MSLSCWCLFLSLPSSFPSTLSEMNGKIIEPCRRIEKKKSHFDNAQPDTCTSKNDLEIETEQVTYFHVFLNWFFCVTSVHKIIQVSSVKHNTSSAYCIVYPFLKTKLLSPFISPLSTSTYSHPSFPLTTITEWSVSMNLLMEQTLLEVNTVWKEWPWNFWDTKRDPLQKV